MILSLLHIYMSVNHSILTLDTVVGFDVLALFAEEC